MEQGSAMSSSYILIPDHLRGEIGRIKMGHDSSVSYCYYILAPHYIREESGSSLTIQLKSPTSQKVTSLFHIWHLGWSHPRVWGARGNSHICPDLVSMSFSQWMIFLQVSSKCQQNTCPGHTIGVLLCSNPNSCLCLPHPLYSFSNLPYFNQMRTAIDHQLLIPKI